MELDLYSVLDVSRIKALMESFFEATHIPVGIADTHNRWIVALGWQDICTKFHRVHPESEIKCIESDRYIETHLMDGTYVPYRCAHGMVDVAFPIIVNNTHIGTFFIGQFFDAPCDETFFREQAARYGYDLAAYLDALKKVQVISRERIDQLMQFFMRLVALIVDAGYENLKRRQIEEELWKTNRQLDARVAERTAALAAESLKSATLLRTASDGIHVLDPEGNVVLANEAFCRMLGYTPDEMQSMNVAQWDAQWSSGELKALLARLIQKSAVFETRHRCRDGHTIDVEINASGVEINGQVLVYASARDITQRKVMVERVHHLAHYDLLTDLPNRTLLADRLRQALAAARRDALHMALLFLDLDRFKPVNDTFGHDIGDLLLKAVAMRLRICVRESDTVARVGGDEFVVLLPHIEQEQDAGLVAQKILLALGEPFELAGHQIQISASIGIAVYPEQGVDEQQLLKNADNAMYAAKNDGGASASLACTAPASQGETT